MSTSTRIEVDRMVRHAHGIARAAALAVVLLATLGNAAALAAPARHVQDEVLVRFHPGATSLRRNTLHAATGAAVVKEFTSVPGLQLVKLGPGTSPARALAHYGASADVVYVERNQVLKLFAVPNDPGYASGEMWNLSMYPIVADYDVNAPEAWDITTGSTNVVVAVIDSGIDYTHEDLAANMFRNDADCNANGIDDDGNGFVDDCFGIAPINGDSNPLDDEGHGTHVAGIIGAVGNNGVGVVGVAWRVKLLPCKIFDATGFSTLDAALTCFDYVAAMKDRGVNVVATNNSWGGGEYSAALRDAIDAQRQRGILFVAAAGNYGNPCNPMDCRSDVDNDRMPTYPANYYLPNVISVANMTMLQLNARSAYGRRTVHVAAPGTDILSTTPDNTYDYYSGTSMAAPHVAGLAALLKSQNSARDWKAIKNLILAGADRDLYPFEQFITQRGLNAQASLACANRTVVSRLRPIPDAVHAAVGRPMELAVLNIRCAVPDGNVTVTVSPGGQTITLRDDGAGADQEAGDGIYSARWTPTAQGQFTLAFPGGDVVPVQVLAGAYGVAEVPFAGRTITGTSLTFAMQPAEITSPFPIKFGGGSFTTFWVDERGALQFDGGGFDAPLPFLNDPLPAPYRSTLISPWWDEIWSTWQGQSDVVWEVTGTAPNRELVVEWRNQGRSDQFCALYEGFVTFQVVFFEGRSDVLFNYPDASFDFECADWNDGVSATVGIQVGPDTATMFSFNTAALRDGMSLLWTLAQAAPPVIGVTPASRDFGSVTVGASADATFVVQNTGGGTLTGQATTTAPFSIVSGGAYSLGAGQTQTVTVRFSPTAAGTSNRTVWFTGGGGASRAVTGVGAPPANVPPDLPSALGQIRTDGATVIGVGGWTNQTSVIVKLTMSDASTADTLTPEVEVKPIGTAFTGAGLVAGTAVASTGAPVQGTVTVTGLINGTQYHWRARVRDAAGQTSAWVSFAANAETARDFGVDTAKPTGSVVAAAGSAWTKTRAVSLALKCTDTRSGCSQMQLAQDGGAFTAPEPFSTTRAWTLTGADGKKIVSARYIDGAGNVSATYSDTITLDTTAPVVSAVSATPSPFTLGSSTIIRFRAADALSGTCHADILIRNAGGGIVKSFGKSAGCSVTGTVTSTTWDGRNAARALVPPGTYTIEVIATDTAGNASAVARGTVVAQ